MSDDMRRKLEDHAVAILLAGSGLLFGIGLLLQHAGRDMNRAVTWAAPR